MLSRLLAARRHARTSCSSTLLSIALLRGSIFGAIAGFGAGLSARHREPRHARLHLAAAHARRLLDRALRRDDRPRPVPRAVHSVGVVTVALRARRARARTSCSASRRPRAPSSRAAGDGPAQPDPDLARLRARAAAVPAGRAARPRPRGAAPWLSRPGSRRFLPPRPARRGAVPADAAARAPGRDARLRRARRLRGALPAALGAAGALRRQVPRAGERQPRADDPRSTRRAGPILDRNGHVLVTNVPGTRVELWPADLPKSWPAQRNELERARRRSRRARADRSWPGSRRRRTIRSTPVVVQRGIHHDQVDYLAEHQLEFPGVQLAAELPAQATRTSRSPRRCSATSGRSRQPS